VEKKDRKSWVIWQEEGRYPNVIVELLSDSTAASDKELKKQIYQDIFRTPKYFWFEPTYVNLAPQTASAKSNRASAHKNVVLFCPG
jgi:Uma2 family endonuclease